MLRIAVVASLAAGLAAPAMAQDLRQVPRNRTLITQGWDYYNQVQSPGNLSPYNGVLLNQRQVLHYTVQEALFYTNHMSNEIIPWQAEAMKTSADFREVTITLRPGVKWADGKPFTAEDVAFTFDTLKANAPDMALSSSIKEWVASATATDARTVVIKLNKPGPRWAQDTLATGQVSRFIVLPKHVWAGKDAKTFGDVDIAQGWPLGTGPYRVVRADSNSIVFDRTDKWWAVDAGVTKAMPAPERIIYRPATADALPQLYTAGEIDTGRALQVGSFEAAKGRNPNLISWNAKGPVWGVTAGCTHRLAFNNQSAPFDKVEARQAVAALIDRDQVADLAWEGSAPVAYAPFASYPGMQAYTKQLDAQIRAASPRAPIRNGACRTASPGRSPSTPSRANRSRPSSPASCRPPASIPCSSRSPTPSISIRFRAEPTTPPSSCIAAVSMTPGRHWNISIPSMPRPAVPRRPTCAP